MGCSGFVVTSSVAASQSQELGILNAEEIEVVDLSLLQMNGQTQCLEGFCLFPNCPNILFT